MNSRLSHERASGLIPGDWQSSILSSSLDMKFQSLEVEIYSFQVLLTTSIIFSGASHNQHLKESPVFIKNFQLHFSVFI